MSRYFTRPGTAPRAYWINDNGDTMRAVDMVSVSEHHSVDTGLVDAAGDPIMRAPYPIGFGRDKEWA